MLNIAGGQKINRKQDQRKGREQALGPYWGSGAVLGFLQPETGIILQINS